MATLPRKTADTSAETSMSLLHDLFGSYHPRNFAVRLWDGTTWEAEPGQPARFTLVLQHAGALRMMFLPPNELTLGEAYIYNDFDIEGDIHAIYPLADHFIQGSWGKMEQMRYGKRLLSLPKSSHTASLAANLRGTRHSKDRDRQAIIYHYNRSNDFYALWLDARMVYSCAYFAAPGDDLDAAQERKLDYLCRKLRLRPGERLLDIGCGWGGLVIYAAQHYGVEAYGITLSQPQAELAQQHIHEAVLARPANDAARLAKKSGGLLRSTQAGREAGLTDRCRVDVRDYRDMNETNSFDKIVSVGMFEHVGDA